jgi:protein-tyrosine kinase
MSQIFDALLRAETERSGSASATLADATELLRNAERQASSKWAPSTVIYANEEASSEAPVALVQEVDLRDTGILDAGKDRGLEGDPTIWSQFKTRKLSSSPNGRLVTLTTKASATSEAFRLLGVRLRDLRHTRPLKKLLLTSTVPQEGKSTVAANLACALAHKSGERVLLVEGDVWRPSLTALFELGTIPGLRDLLEEHGGLTEGIFHLEEAGIWMLPAGTTPATPLGLLQSQRLPVLMEQLSTLFDWVIIDSPPVLPMADTSIWTRFADGILLVVRQGTTEKQQLEKGVRALDSEKLIGALLNCSKASTYKSYYYNPPTFPESMAG